jgi:hypothetical protein
MRIAAANAFGLRPHQHLMAEIGTDHRHFRCPFVGKGQITGAGTQIENRRRTLRRYHSDRAGPPALIDIQAEQVIQKVVPWSDLAEHAADALIAFIEQRHEIPIPNASG